jgi:hypothetical protein
MERVQTGGEEILCDALGMTRNQARGVKEFAEFRIGFQNAQVPAAARERASDGVISSYLETMQAELDGFAGSRDSFVGEVARVDGRELAVLTVEYCRAAKSRQAEKHRSSADPMASVAAFDRAGVDVFHESAWLRYDRDLRRFTIVKPLARAHWTVERAVVDAEQMIAEAMSPARRGGP